MIQDREQGGFFVPGFGNTLVECVISGDSGEEVIKLIFQPEVVIHCRMLLVCEELPVELPVLIQECVQERSVIGDAGVEFFVESPIMNPTQRQGFCDQLKLGRIIANEHPDDRELQLGMVGGYGGCIQNMGSLPRSQVGEMGFYKVEKILFRDLLVMGEGV